MTEKLADTVMLSDNIKVLQLMAEKQKHKSCK